MDYQSNNNYRQSEVIRDNRAADIKVDYASPGHSDSRKLPHLGRPDRDKKRNGNDPNSFSS